MLSRDEIFSKAEQLKKREVNIPEWGGTVFVRELTGLERDAWELSNARAQEKGRLVDGRSIRAKLIAKVVVDEKGDHVFSDNDVVRLGKTGAKALDRIYDVAVELSGLREDAAEEVAKNSPSGQQDD